MNRFRFVRVAPLLAIGAIAFCTSAHSQDSGSQSSTASTILFDEQAQNKGIFSFDYGPPTSPALQLVSASPTKFKTSTALKPYVISLPAGFGGADGQNSFAFDVSPAWLVNSASEITYSEYKAESAEWLGPVWTRLQFSGALDVGTNAEGNVSKQVPSKGGFGISTSLLDDDDPVLTKTSLGDKDADTYWDDCVTKASLGPAKAYADALNQSFNNSDPGLPIAQLTESIKYLTGEKKPTPNPPTDLASYQGAVLRELKVCVNQSSCAGLDKSSQLKLTLSSLADDPSKLTKEQGTALEKIIQSMVTVYAAENVKDAKPYSDAIQACIKNSNILAQQAPGLDLGSGVVWQGVPGKIKGFTDPAEIIWAGGRFPLYAILAPGTRLQGASNQSAGTAPIDELHFLSLGGSVRAGWNELSATGNKTTPEIKADTLDAWAGLQRGTPGSLLAAQGGYTEVKAVDSIDDKFSKSGIRWQLSASLKLGDTLSGFVGSLLKDFGSDQSLTNGVWINVTYGTARGTSTTLNDKAVMVSFSYSATPGTNDVLGGSSSPYGGSANPSTSSSSAGGS